MKKTILILALAMTGLFACTKVTDTGKKQVLVTERLDVDYNDDYPNHFQFSFSTVDNNMASLGRVLFYDEALSINERISCSSCHLQANAFAESKAFSTGFAMAATTRNSMSLGNTDQSNILFWDGRESNLLDQVTKPITNHIEMGYGSVEDMVARIKTKDYYPVLFANAFNGSASPEAITSERVSNALTAFISSIRSYRNKLDNALAVLPAGSSPWGDFSSAAVEFEDDQEQRGFELFGALGCASCHSGKNVGGNSFANIGLDIHYADQGVGSWMADPEAMGNFKIPSLRNVALSAPYMHDGRFATLEQVIEHYNSGIQPHENLSWRLQNFSEFETVNEIIAAGIDPTEIIITGDDEILENRPIQPLRLGLTEDQKSDLLAFLRSLTDTEMIRDTRYTNPFDYVAE